MQWQKGSPTRKSMSFLALRDGMAYCIMKRKGGGLVVYCEKCKALSEDNCCAFCGSGRVRLPRWGDFCVLTERGYMWTSLLEELLKDEGIPAVSQKVLDHGFGLWLHDRHRVCVPYESYEQAKELLDVVLNSPVFWEE